MDPKKLFINIALSVLCLLNGSAQAGFCLKWGHSGIYGVPSFVSRFPGVDGNTNGNVQRERPWGDFLGGGSAFALIENEFGNLRVMDLSTGDIYGLGVDIAIDITNPTAFRVVYGDVDADGFDEAVFFANAHGMNCVDWEVSSGADGEELQYRGSSLSTARPSPNAGRTTIGFTLATAGEVELQIFDVNGRLMRRLLDGKLPGGLYSIPWDGLDDMSSPLASGTYFYRLLVDGQLVGTERTVVLR